MAATQAVKYAPQCGDMIVESVQFQSNNLVVNFNYPQSIPAYNKGNYVSHPSPEIVKAEVRKITNNEALDPSKVTLIELTTSMIKVINQESSVTPLPFSEKKKKKKSQTVTQPKPKSHGLEASGALPQKRKKSKPKTTSLVQVTVTPPSAKVSMEDSDKTQSVSLGQTAHPQDTKGHTYPAVKGFHSPLD
ncbi:hypothetical protein Tco_1209083 [Tanacetum coccineum]